MKNLIKHSKPGMTLLELSAGIVVISIIAIGMTSGAQAVMLHYQSDTVRQDLRSYGNNIIREIVRELNQAQRIEIDGANGFARLKLYRYFTDLTPELTIDCQRNKGIQFNAGVPVDGVLRFPSEGVFRGPNRRSVYVDDFLVNYNFDTGPGSQTFKGSYLELTLILAMEEDVMDDSFRPNKEQHIYHRSVFLGSSYINSRVTNMMGLDNEV